MNPVGICYDQPIDRDPSLMITSPVRLYNPSGDDRVAVVSAEPATGAKGFLLRLARGPRSKQLSMGMVFGPFSAEDLPARLEEVIAALKSEGFAPSGLAGMLKSLTSPHSAIRARAAIRLGWHRSVEAVAPILEALSRSVDDSCSLIDALGAIGDPRAIPVVREFAGRKLLSRRRSAVEALRNLGDLEGLSLAIQRSRESLPVTVQTALDGIDPQDETDSSIKILASSIRSLDEKFQGQALDHLYEIGTPLTVGAVRSVLAELSFDRPYLWRYVKSIYKRSQLRFDIETFGWLSHAIEAQSRGGAGSKAKVKSGYDGVERLTAIFGTTTQGYICRLGWRFLRNVAVYRPRLYAHSAAEVLVAYTPDDADEPRGLRGEFARCYLLNRILFGDSKRLRLDDRRQTFHFRDADSTQPPPAIREETFPELWDAEPTAYLRVLGASKLPEAHAFAARAIAGPHRQVLEAASADAVVRLLLAPHEATVRLGLEELDRRFDATNPDLILVDRLLAENLPSAKELGQQWLRRTSPLWTEDEEWVLVFLGFPDPVTSSLAADLAAPALRDRPEMRRSLAVRLLSLLRMSEASPGTHDVYARVASEVLAVEMGHLLSVADLVTMVTSGSPPVQALAGDLLGHRPEALDQLGIEGLTSLAGHDVAAVRSAAHSLMRSAELQFQKDAAPLFLLAESEWDDTRALAFEILRRLVGQGTLGPAGVLGLLDSNRTDVQDMGRELVKRHAAELDPRVLMARLAEHPHPNMRRFALDLIVEHLPEGYLALVQLEPFFRGTMLDLRPDRLLKRRTVDFLLTRGLCDDDQARVAARMLGEFARMNIRSDSEHALEAIVRLNLRYPALASPVLVDLGGTV